MGAQKTTVQALGILIQVLNQNLRAQATQQKLMALDLANQNERNKAATKHFLESAGTLKQAMQREKIKFELPRL